MLKKIAITFILAIVATMLFAQEQERPFKVGYWVFVEDQTYRERAINEIAEQLENSSEWNFQAMLGEWDTDIHLVINGMPDTGSGFAWSITFTPIFQPMYTNGRVGISEDSISGINWASRQAVIFIEEQLYIMMDELTRDET